MPSAPGLSFGRSMIPVPTIPSAPGPSFGSSMIPVPTIPSAPGPAAGCRYCLSSLYPSYLQFLSRLSVVLSQLIDGEQGALVVLLESLLLLCHLFSLLHHVLVHHLRRETERGKCMLGVGTCNAVQPGDKELFTHSESSQNNESTVTLASQHCTHLDQPQGSVVSCECSCIAYLLLFHHQVCLVHLLI